MVIYKAVISRLTCCWIWWCLGPFYIRRCIWTYVLTLQNVKSVQMRTLI